MRLTAAYDPESICTIFWHIFDESCTPRHVLSWTSSRVIVWLQLSKSCTHGYYSSGEDPGQIVFTSPQIAIWTHAGLPLGLTELTTFLHDFHCVLLRVVTSLCREHVDELVTGLSTLPHREHETGCRQTWSCCDQKIYFGAIWKHFLLDSVHGHQRTDWFALRFDIGLPVVIQKPQLLLLLRQRCLALNASDNFTFIATSQKIAFDFPYYEGLFWPACFLTLIERSKKIQMHIHNDVFNVPIALLPCAFETTYVTIHWCESFGYDSLHSSRVLPAIQKDRRWTQ